MLPKGQVFVQKSASKRQWVVTWQHENTSARIRKVIVPALCNLAKLLFTHRKAWCALQIWRFSRPALFFVTVALDRRCMDFFFKRKWVSLLWLNTFCSSKHFLGGGGEHDPTLVIFLLFPCVFLLLQTSGRCCGLCCYLMQWAVSRVSGVSPRVSETVSSSWRWTLPSTPTQPASTSHPAWSCATGHRTSELLPGSWCRQ